MDALSRGDLAWWTGDRPAAVAAWHEALDDGPAFEAMARIRLLRREGNLAPFWHEKKLDRALASCPRTEEACRLAEADYLLFMPRFAGGDPARVEEVLAGLHTPGAEARRVAAGAAFSLLDGLDLDGMGQGIVATGQRSPPDPGTWTLGVGIGAAPGAGAGLAVRFVHPDLGGHRLDLAVAADTRFGGYVSAALLTRRRLQVTAFGAHAVGDLYDGDTVATYTWWSARGSLGWAPRMGSAVLQVGGAARVDDGLVNAGPYASASGSGLRLWMDAGMGDYDHLGLGVDARGGLSVAGGTLAGHMLVSVVPTDSPWFRLPSAGGQDLLRGLPAGRLRGPTLLGAQAEYRHPIWGPVHGAVFFDAAVVDAAAWTAGGGLRLVLPPERDNITRIDVGAGPEGWGVVVGWGEAF